MSKAKFTKGEWLFQGDSVGVIDKSDSQSFGMMNGVCHVDMIEFGLIKGEANAHLIAAAPEMYELLETMCNCSSVKVVDLGDGMTIDISEIKKLLAKARGES